MYAPERHEAIASLVRQRGRVAVSEVAASFGVTTETVRRDLAHLERAGLVRRVHGGAVPVSSLSTVERGMAERVGAYAEQKDRIARAALDLVPSAGGALILDAGTTTGRLASMLPTDRQVTVVTNSVPIAGLVVGNPGLRLQLLGGRVRATTHAAVGESTVGELQNFVVDVAFMGTNGVSAEHGLTTPDHEEASVKRAMVGTARQVVVLADSSKVGQTHLVRFADADQVDILVTDTGIDADTRRELEAADIEVLIA